MDSVRRFHLKQTGSQKDLPQSEQFLDSVVDQAKYEQVQTIGPSLGTTQICCSL